MARNERQFTFRFTAEGFRELVRDLQQGGDTAARAVDRLTQASPQLQRSTVVAAEAMERQAVVMQRQAASTTALVAAQNTAIISSARFRTVIQQAGFQVGDFATQVAAGGNALTAFVQQGSQLLGLFGAGGAIAGAVLAIGGIAANMLLVGRNTETATTATEDYTSAQQKLASVLGEVNRLLETQIERTRRVEEERRKELAGRLASSRVSLERQRGPLLTEIGVNEAEIARAARSRASSEQIEAFTATQRQNITELQAQLRVVDAQLASIDEAEKTLFRTPITTGESNSGGIATGVARVRDLNRELPITRQRLAELRQAEEARQRFAERAIAEAETERRRAAEREAQEFARVWQRATDTAVERSGDYFFDLFTGRATDIGEALRNSLLRAVADAAANFLVRPIIAPVIGAVGSAVGGIFGGGDAGGGGFGALGNLLGLGSSAYQAVTGQSLLGGLTGINLGGISAGGLFSTAAPAITSAQAAGIVAGGQAPFTFTAAGAGGTTGALGIGLTSALGAAGIGFGAGTLIGAFGGNRTVSSVGGAAIGAGAGFLIGGPVGAIIGGLGGAAGGIFGGQKQAFSGGTSVLGIDPATGQLTVLGDTGKRYDAGSIAAAVRPEVAQVNALLASGGIRISSAGLGFNPLSSTQPFAGYGPGTGDGSQYGGTVESVLLTLLGQGRLSSQSATVNRVLRSGGVTGLASLQEGLQFATLFDQLKAGTDVTTELERAMKALREQLAEAEKEAKKYGFAQGEVTKATRQAFERDIGRQILGITDPLKLALEDFDRSARARLEVAKTLGADLVQVERLTQLQRKQIIEQLTPSAAAAPGGRSLSGLVDDVVFGGLSSGTASQRFFASQTRYNQARRAALSDPADLEARAAFETQARAFLPIARDFLGTSARFGAIERDVLSAARRLDPAADPAQIAAQKIVDSQALAASLQVGATNAVRAEIIGLRADFNRLSQVVAALARKAA